MAGFNIDDPKPKQVRHRLMRLLTEGLTPEEVRVEYARRFDKPAPTGGLVSVAAALLTGRSQHLGPASVGKFRGLYGNGRRVTVEGRKYRSVRQAAEGEGVSPTTVQKRCASDEWPTWVYVDGPEDAADWAGTFQKPGLVNR